MLGIQFSLRDSSGNIEQGTLSLSEASETLSVSGAQDVSLNTSSAAIGGYARDGGDLVITFLGGKTLRLEGYFAGGDKDLLLSERGLMTEVEFGDLGGGELVATYADVDLTGKWSEYDQLAYLDLERVEPVVAPLIAPALLGLNGAAVAGAAGLAGLGLLAAGGSAAEADTTAPDVVFTNGVDSTNDVVNGADYNDGTVSIGGSGEAGASIAVTVNDTTETTTVAEDGTWVVDFDSADLDEGEYTTDVTVVTTDASGNSTTVVDTLVVDTEAEDLTFDTVEGDDVINIAEANDGVTFTGVSEAGATVVVELEGQTVETTVAEDGTWTATFDAGALPDGTYDSVVTATVTDAVGNAATYTHTVHVDLEGSVTINAGSIGGDGTVNASENASAVDISGTGEPGSTVVVTVSGASATTTVGSDGSWTATFDAGTLPNGTYDATVTAVATDAAGNSVSSSGTFHIDTEVGVAIDAGHSGGDEVVNFDESGEPLAFTGTADAGSTVVVTLAGVSLTTVAGSDGAWAVAFDAGTLAPGEYDTALTAVATDANGNTSTSTTSVTVDTVAGEVALSSTPIEGDNVINAVEVADGVLVSGTATPGLDVTVTLGGATHVVTASAAGTFSTVYSSTEVTPGEYDTTVTASITDAAGNSKSVSAGVQVDTYVDNFSAVEVSTGADNVMNATETAEGLTLSGTVEPGSSVVVTLNGTGYTATVADNGGWSIEVPANALPTGEGDYDVSVIATDPAGNVSTLTETITYDTLVNELSMDSTVGGDGVFNAQEMNSGVTLTGTVEPGSTVNVTVQGITQAASVDANGNWSVTYADGTLAAGDYTAQALIEATDAAGNTASITETFGIDTEGEVASVLGYSRSLSGISSVDVTETDNDLSVFAIDADGNTSEVSVTVDDGEIEFDTDVPNGSQIVISSEDDAGNTSDTLFVLDTGHSRPEGVYFDVDIDSSGLNDFDLGSIDLQFVNGGELTISGDDLDRITGLDSTLTVHGGGDDRVVLTDTATSAGSTDIDGQSYDIYTLGDEGTIYIDSEIEVILP